MKYLKKFEYNEENKDNKDLVHDFKDKILILLNHFFKDNNYDATIYCEDYVQSGNYYSNFKYVISFIFEINGEKTDPFLEIDITFDYNFEILFYPNYVGINSTKITEKFKKYFISIMKPLSFIYDNDVEFNFHKKKFKKLISKLSVETYKLNNDIEKFNL